MIFFFRTRKRGTRGKKRKKIFHELCERGHSRTQRGKGSGWQTGWRALPLIASPLPGGLVGGEQRPRSPPLESRQMALARGRGRAGLLRLGVIIGSPGLLELALDEIFLQLLPITDHKLFGEILQEQNKSSP